LSDLSYLAEAEPTSPPRWPLSLVGNIAREIAEDIVAGRLRPGHDLNSVELARRFDTSRTPVREALLLLEKEGLVEIASHRRPRVKRWSWEEVCAVHQVCAALNALVAELVVTKATNSQLDVLDAIYRDLAAANEKGDVEAYFAASVTFCDIELHICGNAPLRQLIENLEMRLLPLRHYSIATPDGMRESCEDRGRVLRAYHERDGILAVAMNRSIALRALERIKHRGQQALD
jgi:DNA-binding GntR family transcriptional regulator